MIEKHFKKSLMYKNKGMSILVALIIVSTLMLLATLALKISSDELDIARHDLFSLQAYYAAESGMMRGFTAVCNDHGFTGVIDDTLEVDIEEDTANVELKYAVYRVVVSGREKNVPEFITSTGNFMGKSRTLTARINSVTPVTLTKPREITLK